MPSQLTQQNDWVQLDIEPKTQSLPNISLVYTLACTSLRLSFIRLATITSLIDLNSS